MSSETKKFAIKSWWWCSVLTCTSQKYLRIKERLHRQFCLEVNIWLYRNLSSHKTYILWSMVQVFGCFSPPHFFLSYISSNASSNRPIVHRLEGINVLITEMALSSKQDLLVNIQIFIILVEAPAKHLTILAWSVSTAVVEWWSLLEHPNKMKNDKRWERAKDAVSIQ